jgi:hypothetical protein
MKYAIAAIVIVFAMTASADAGPLQRVADRGRATVQKVRGVRPLHRVRHREHRVLSKVRPRCRG